MCLVASQSIFRKDAITLFNQYNIILIIPQSTNLSIVNHSLSQHHEFTIFKNK